MDPDLDTSRFVSSTRRRLCRLALQFDMFTNQSIHVD